MRYKTNVQCSTQINGVWNQLLVAILRRLCSTNEWYMAATDLWPRRELYRWASHPLTAFCNLRGCKWLSVHLRSGYHLTSFRGCFISATRRNMASCFPFHITYSALLECVQTSISKQSFPIHSWRVTHIGHFKLLLGSVQNSHTMR